MLESLANMYGQATSEIVRSALAVVLAGGIVSLVVMGASDMGLGTEIANNRVLIWTCTAGLAFLLGLSYEIYSLTARLSEQSAESAEVQSKNEGLREELEEAKDERDSALRLMENYKRDAYDEVLSDLYIIVKALERKDSWMENGACVTQVSVDIEDVENNLSLPERVNRFSNINIDIGSKDGVIEGMRFSVFDPSITFNYGKILVKDTGENGSLCKLVEGYDRSLWSEVVSSINDEVNRVINIKYNRIVPIIPEEVEEAKPDALEELRRAVEYVSKIN